MLNHFLGRVGVFEDWNFPDITARVVGVNNATGFCFLSVDSGQRVIAVHSRRFLWWSDSASSIRS